MNSTVGGINDRISEDFQKKSLTCIISAPVRVQFSNHRKKFINQYLFIRLHVTILQFNVISIKNRLLEGYHK